LPLHDRTSAAPFHVGETMTQQMGGGQMTGQMNGNQNNWWMNGYGSGPNWMGPVIGVLVIVLLVVMISKMMKRPS
jgi:hypothetical protein